MFEIYDDFKAYDENFQPYTMSVERHTETANLHSAVISEGFSLRSIGNRHIIASPRFSRGEFTMSFKVTYLFEKVPVFFVIFGYDEATRRGSAIRVRYELEGRLRVCRGTMMNCEFTPSCEEQSAPMVWDEERAVAFSLTLGANEVICGINGALFTFDSQGERGRIALDRLDFIGELIIERYALKICEDQNERLILDTDEIEIPLTNGGDIPYTVKYTVKEIDGERYLTARLGGGTRSRKVDRKERVGQYVAEKDFMTSPYVGLRTENGSSRYYLTRGKTAFIDPNIFWECQKSLFGDTELPITNCYKLKEPVLGDEPELVFGYEDLFCTGYETQSGKREFRFSADGALLCEGAPDGESYEILSPFDKKAIALIPQDIFGYDEIVRHLRHNHYFVEGEEISFTLKYTTEIRPEYLDINARLLDVFETRVISELRPRVRRNSNTLEAFVTAPSQKVGVYKVAFDIFYGDRKRESFICAFEVFDPNSDKCPPLESGIPFMFGMHNEFKKLERNLFDLHSPKSSDDICHYIACATDTPVEAEKREVWRYLKTFGRKWFAWLAIRTCNDYLSPTHDITIKNADYLFHTGINTDEEPLGGFSLFPNRLDHFSERFYKHDAVKRWIDEFYESYPSGDGDALIEYINEKGASYIKNHNVVLRKQNPKVKRAIYGPFAPYFAPTLTYHSLKYYGFPCSDDLANEYYSGFAIYEDYPFSCSYQTYRGPFAIMTVLLYVPGLTVYPELYTGSLGGCIDGAVKNAHAPMGAYTCPPYQNLTEGFEYAVNTAYKTRDGFRYWNTYGFHRGVDTAEYINEFVKGWHHILDHKPHRPLRSICYIVDYEGDDDVSNEVARFFNQSESGQAIVCECAREAGVPGGFGIRPQDLDTVTEEDCDLLVIPSLKYASSELIENIKRLYEKGVDLIALSDVTGLEDIFGVKKCPISQRVTTLYANGIKENVYNTDARFEYAPENAEAAMTVNNGIPAILVTSRTTLINTSLLSLGCSDPKKIVETKGAFLVSELTRRVIIDEVRRLSSPTVFGENVGVTLYEDEEGNTVLFAVDYSPFDNKPHSEHEAIVRIELHDVTSVKSYIDVRCARIDGCVREMRFDIEPHGYAFITLERSGDRR